MNTKFDCDIVNGLSNALGGRVDLLEKMLGLKVRQNLRYSDIQKIVKSGFAEEFFDIGDEIMTKYTATDGTVYDFPWLIVDFRDVEWEDGTEHPGMVLQAKYATAEKVTFDAPEDIIVNHETEPVALEGWYYFGQEEGKSYAGVRLNLDPGVAIPFDDYVTIHKFIDNDANISEAGYSNYKMSAIRQWLNSDADVNEWWEPTHLGDIAPSELNTLKGFISGFSRDFIDMIKPSKVQAATNYDVNVMYDKMFLPSVPEMYGRRIFSYNSNTYREKDINADRKEGPYFKYWKERTGLNYPDGYENEGRIISIVNGDNNDNMPYCWTRSYASVATNYTPCSAYIIMNENGQINNVGSPVFALHTLPCCIIS